MTIKIDFGMIVFNGDYVLKENLESIYPFANKIIIVEGPVKYYISLGHMVSTDNTVSIIKSFPDPENKITLIQGQWVEKDEMCNAYAKHLTGDYVWHVDSDEIYKKEDMEKIIQYLDDNKDSCYSMAFRLYSFYGGFERYISGFEENFETIRIQKIIPGQSRWLTHRPPTMIWPLTGKTCKEMGHIDHMESERLFGARIYHYPYVFPTQVMAKIAYYSSWGTRGIIKNYFETVYVPWMNAKTEEEKLLVETPTLGVQEWIPQRRGPAFTVKFNGTHPEVIEKTIQELNNRVDYEVNLFGVLI
jgi:hypothetical protein